VAATQVLIREPRTTRLWAVARWSAMAAVPPLLVGLVLAPGATLTALWYGVIPLLPATFFLSPVLWRGVCPLATLNEWGNRLGAQRALSQRGAAALSVGGLLLFHLMVPARRLLFNANGPVLAATVLAVAVLALLLGAVFVVRSGFCNALCPVLPVELLYGQAPLLRLDRGRCTSCTVCTPRRCQDLVQGKAFSRFLEPGRGLAGWLTTPYGMFIAALPGFIVGYSLLTDVPLRAAASVYGTTLGASLASYAVIAALVLGFRVPSRVAHPLIAALAGELYYWYAGPAIATHLREAGWLGTGLRGVGMGLVALWLVRTLARRTNNGEGSG